MYKLVIVDDEPMVCQWLTAKIDWSRWDCEIVGVGRNGLEGKELVEKHKPDILLSDVKMPGINGLELSHFILEQYPKTLVVMLSGYNEFDFVRTAMRNKVFDYLLKPLDVEDLLKTMDKASSYLQERLDCERKNEISEKRLEETSVLTEIGILMKLMINGNNELSLLKDQISHLGLVFSRGQVVVYQMHNSLQDKWAAHYQYAVRNVLMETFQRYHLIPLVMHIGETCVVVAKFVQGGLPLWEKRVLQAAEEGLDNVRMYLKSKQSLGIGAVFKSIEELYPSYQSAISRLELHYFWLDDSLPSVNGAITIEDGSAFTVDKALYEWIESGDEQASVSYLSTAKAKLRKIGKREFVYSVFTEILIHLSKISEKWNKELDFVPLMNNMQQYRTFDTLMQELIGTVSCLCRWIAKQKSYATSSLPDKVVIYVRKNFQNPDINLGTISELFHISLSHLSRTFVRSTGVNFNEFVSQLRVDEAKKLMEQQHWLSNQEIAERVGYNDGRYFSQVFKKLCGKTPNEYRGRREANRA